MANKKPAPETPAPETPAPDMESSEAISDLYIKVTSGDASSIIPVANKAFYERQKGCTVEPATIAEVKEVYPD